MSRLTEAEVESERQANATIIPLSFHHAEHTVTLPHFDPLTP